MSETALIKIEGLESGIQSLPSILERNQLSVQRANDAMQSYLDTIEASGGKIRNDEIDKAVSELLAKVSKTTKEMYERRAPMTRILAEVTRMFTAQENELSNKTIGSRAYNLEKLRNEYATFLLEQKKEAERKAAAELQAKTELADVKTSIDAQIRKRFIEFSATEVAKLKALFDRIDLENYPEISAEIASFPISYTLATHSILVNSLMPEGNPFRPLILVTKEQFKDEMIKASGWLFKELAQIFMQEVSVYKEELYNKVPGRVKELEAIEKAGEEERKRLEEEKRIRDQEATAALKAKQDQAKAEQEAKEERERLAARTQTLFDSHAATAEASVDVSSANVKEALELVVLNQSGFMPIISFYFEKEGLKEDIEKLGKKTLESMRKFAENWANKTDERIKHPAISYKTIAKAGKR